MAVAQPDISQEGLACSLDESSGDVFGSSDDSETVSVAAPHLFAEADRDGTTRHLGGAAGGADVGTLLSNRSGCECTAALSHDMEMQLVHAELESLRMQCGSFYSSQDRLCELESSLRHMNGLLAHTVAGVDLALACCPSGWRCSRWMSRPWPPATSLR